MLLFRLKNQQKNASGNTDAHVLFVWDKQGFETAGLLNISHYNLQLFQTCFPRIWLPSLQKVRSVL